MIAASKTKRGTLIMAWTIFIIPLTIIPWIVFNIVGVTSGDGPWNGVIFDLPMVSQQVWDFTWRDLMVVFGVVCLFGEVLKSTNTSSRAIVNHILSTLVFIVYLVEFIVVGFAAQSVFFILMILALFDVLAGLTISIKAARRDLAVGHGEGM
jgi:hypothetical protein